MPISKWPKKTFSNGNFFFTKYKKGNLHFGKQNGNNHQIVFQSVILFSQKQRLPPQKTEKMTL